MTITVLLVDDHEIVRDGIRELLMRTPGISVVSSASSGEEAICQVEKHLPNVVLMDISMPGIGGIEASRKIIHKFPSVRVIALSVHAEGPFPQQLIGAGAAGYVTKNSDFNELIKAIRTVSIGKKYLSNDVATALVCSDQSLDSPFKQLSLRELQVVHMTLDGKSIQEMASLLKIASKTVNTYRYRVQEKLSVKNDVELTKLALKYRLIQDH